MGYLRPIDYLLHIQDREAIQIISGNNLVKIQAENWAIAEIRSILTQRWDCQAEFKDTHIWSPVATYSADDLVYLDSSNIWVNNVTYAVNSVVIDSANIYIKNNTTAGYIHQVVTDTTYWILLGKQYDMFNVLINGFWYDSNTFYYKNDVVFYNNFYYTCFQDNKGITPDNRQNGTTFWGTKTASTIPIGTLPTNTNYFIAGDNRSQIIFNLAIDIAVYRTLIRLPYPIVAKRREKAYEEAMEKLNNFRHGNDVLEDFPTIQAVQGLRTMMQSNHKNTNIY